MPRFSRTVSGGVARSHMVFCELVRVRQLICLVSSALWTVPAWAQPPALAEIAGGELARNFEILKAGGKPAPYFMSYGVWDLTEDVVRASLGAILRSATDRRRLFDCSVRTGSPLMDNYHLLDNQPFRMSRAVHLPVEDFPDPIRRILWFETSQCYDASVRRLAEISGKVSGDNSQPSGLPDFSAAAPVKAMHPVAETRVDRAAWAVRLRKLSAAFKEFPSVLQSEVNIVNNSTRKVLVNSEGTVVQTGTAYSRVVISSRGKAYDGEDIQVFDSFEAFQPARLPDDGQLLKSLMLQADLVTRLKRSPESEAYKGPVIFSAPASAILFAEVLGHGLQAPGRQSALLASQVGQTILPESFTIVSAPSISQAGEHDLIGSYTHDDEGVPARPVVLVEKGVLKSLLCSRTPSAGCLESNGHGRKQPGFEPAARLSNFFVDSTVTVGGDDLKAKLIAEATKQKKPYALYIERLRIAEPTPGVRQIIVTSAYRISTEGRRDQLVRGVALSGDMMSLFRNIIAVDAYKEALNLMEMGESGLIPVSIVAPPILVNNVELKPTRKPADRPPFLPRPT